MATSNKEQLITSESKIAFNCMYDLYFVRTAPNANLTEACRFLSQFHPVTPAELPQLKPHMLQSSVQGKTVIEYMRNKNVRLCAKYIGPRPATDPSAPVSTPTATQIPLTPSYAPQTPPSVPLDRPPMPQPSKPENTASKKMARKLKAHGNFFCGVGIFGLGLIGLGFLTAIAVVIICLVTSGRLYFFDDEVAGPFWGLAFSFLGLGGYLTPLYLFGLHFQGQGQIVTNTEN